MNRSILSAQAAGSIFGPTGNGKALRIRGKVQQKAALACLLALVLLVSCSPLPESGSLVAVDLRPPALLDWKVEQERGMKLLFSESVMCSPENLSLSPDLGIAAVETANDGSMNLEFSSKQEPGRDYALRGSAEDEKGNSLTFLLPFTGFNGEIPRIRINEISIQGSGKHPDCVEFYCESGGNLAGVAFFIGTRTAFSRNFVFPPARVQAGDVVVLHTRPQGIPGEKNETSDKASSEGYDATDSAWDFWMTGGSGLPGTNGVLTVYTSKAGEGLDAVFYTNRRSDSDPEYGGFGSTSMRTQVEEIAAEGLWKTHGNEAVPEDGVPSMYSTSTRTICRSSLAVDTDSRADWHTVPTRKASFGTTNSDEVHQPPVSE